MIGIIVSRELPGLNSEEIVVADGTIYLPKLHRVFVSGLTVGELNKVLDKAYMKYIKFPEIEVSIKAYRLIRVYVKGEVESPLYISFPGAYSVDSSPGYMGGDSSDYLSFEDNPTS